jgi:hypothetical protein
MKKPTSDQLDYGHTFHQHRKTVESGLIKQ